MYPFIAKYFIYYPLQLMRGENISQFIRSYEKSQWHTIEDNTRSQFHQMKAILSYCYNNIPYYRRILKEKDISPDDVKGIDDWQRLPFLCKNNLQNDFLSLQSEQKFTRLESKTTGGSTGEAVTLFKNPEALARARAAMYRGYSWYGIGVGDKQARFWGVPLIRKEKMRYELIDLLMNRKRFSAFRFKEEELAQYISCLLKFKPMYLYGYVSMLVLFAQYLQSTKYIGRNLGIKHIITTSEVLQDWQRDLLKATFRCTVQNEYGCGEVGPIAYECPSGQMHLSSENLYVELIPSDEYSGLFDIVLTELYNRAMPLLRYKIGDFATQSAGVCDCGRGLPVIGTISGRAYDFIELPDGTKFHGEQIMYMFEKLKKEHIEIKQFQVVQKKDYNLEVMIVCEKVYCHKIKERLNKIFLEFLNGVAININFVQMIQRENSGKIRLIKNELNKQ